MYISDPRPAIKSQAVATGDMWSNLSPEQKLWYEQNAQAQAEDFRRRHRRARTLAQRGLSIEDIASKAGVCRRTAASVFEETERKKLTQELRELVFERDGGRCVYCGSAYKACIDHIRPLNHSGRTVEDNLQTLCGSCNSRKRARL